MKFTVISVAVALMVSSWAQTSTTTKEVEAVFPDARALYVDLHQTSELSAHEGRSWLAD